MPRQLTLDLPVQPALARSDFMVSPANADALALIDAPGLWPLRKLLLIGPEGAGKSHLAQVFAHDHNALVMNAAQCAPGFHDAAPNPLSPAVVIENADAVAGNPWAEEALFHLHNTIQSRGGLLLLTARTAPSFWGIGLPDLMSRMQATATATLQAPDDALLAAVLVKHFADRQLRVPPALIAWVVSRMERSLAAARDLAAALDARALAEGRPVTRAMAADLLDSPSPDAS